MHGPNNLAEASLPWRTRPSLPGVPLRSRRFKQIRCGRGRVSEAAGPVPHLVAVWPQGKHSLSLGLTAPSLPRRLLLGVTRRGETVALTLV